MSTTAAARTAWHHAAQAWPKDPFRPKHLFADAIRAASDRQLNSTTSLNPEQLRKATNAAAALTRLVENRALKAYPMTDRTSKPASFPKHYARILDSVERAERGETFQPGRLARWFNFRWK
ncbi:hypothetical protein JCM8208_000503 [Rhodotorula glutinis]